MYRQAISMRADYTQAYINRGDVLIKLNRTKEAQEVYERALFYDSNNPDIYYNVNTKFFNGRDSLLYIYNFINYHFIHPLSRHFYLCFSLELCSWNKEKRLKL